ncbi:hypothetical protein ACFQE1_12820 [Halobium palmae]|uniref:Uncharacterized protein n=1 Tax=Halobium palmae TaxID=1776492 RepID=A0ABD5S0Z5_9EURY
MPNNGGTGVHEARFGYFHLLQSTYQYLCHIRWQLMSADDENRFNRSDCELAAGDGASGQDHATEATHHVIDERAGELVG